MRLRELLLQALLAAVLLVPAFPGVFFRGEVISSADILFKVLPWERYAPPGFEHPQNILMSDPLFAFRSDYLLCRDAILRGEWPLWNPLEYGGVPLLANFQSAVFYPPRLLHLFMPIDAANTVFFMLKLWLCAMTAYVCGRVIGMGASASRFFSIGWMLSTYVLVWCCWPVTDVSAWIPLLFAGVELAFAGRYRRAFGFLIAGATLFLLAGHPETAFTMSLGLAFYFAARLVLRARELRPVTRAGAKSLFAPAGVFALAWVAALLICAVQLLPFLEYLGNSYTLAARESEEVTMGAPFGSIAAFWAPRFYGTNAEGNFWGVWNSNLNMHHYAGIGVWTGALLLLGPGTKRDPVRRARIMALLIASGVALVLTFNHNLSTFTYDGTLSGAVYYVLTLQFVHDLPLFRSLHKVYHVNFVMFALPLLGAMGFERWFSRPRRLREAWPVLLLPAVAGPVLLWLLWFHGGLIASQGQSDYTRLQLVAALFFFVVTAALLAVSTVIRRPRLMFGALAVALAADLIHACHGLNPTLPADCVFPQTALTSWLRRQPDPCRVGVIEAGIPSGIVPNYGVEEWMGYDGLYPERVRRFQYELGPDLWNAMEPACSIPYYLNDPRYDPAFDITDSDRFTLVETLDGIEVYRNNHAFSRAYLVPKGEAIPDSETLFERLREPAFDPARTALLHAPSGTPLPAGNAEQVGKAVVLERRANSVVVATESNHEAILVLADAYYPGWRVTIDGTPGRIVPAYYAFRGVTVPEGHHEVVFEYRPRTFTSGLLISFAALACCAAAAIRALHSSDRTPA